MNYNVESQHNKKKYHAIERIMLLLDRDTFYEIGSGITNLDDKDSIPYDGVITGYGMIEGKSVYLFAQDFSQQGGSIGLLHGRKIAHIIELAITNRCPVIGIYDSGGARISEGVNALAGCGEMMRYNTLASGYIPQISVVVGPCAGAAAYSPAISDFVFCVNKISNMYITGPSVVESVTGEKCSAEELGGAKVHSSVSGVAHFECNNEKECITKVRKLINILPSCYDDRINDVSLSVEAKNMDFSEVLPSERTASYDVRNFVNQLVDEDSFIEVHEKYATSLVVGFAQISNQSVGIIANQPKNNGGVLDCGSSSKGARIIRFCDAFNIPIITFVDTPGYMPGIEQEHNGIIRHGAKLLFAYAEATTIKLTVIIRKAYGGAYIAMGSKHLGADYVYALPGAEIAVMGAEGAVQILHRKELKDITAEEQKKLLKTKVDEYTQKYLNANLAVRAGYVDEVVLQHQLRNRLINDIISLQRKKSTFYVDKKHSNIPL